MSDTAEKSLVVLTAGLNDEDRMKNDIFSSSSDLPRVSSGLLCSDEDV